MSDNTKQKKLIRARQKASGESYSTARLHVVRGRLDPARDQQPADAEPSAGLRAVVEAVIQLANAAADGSSSADQALRTYLTDLAPGDLRKVEVLMYAGRSDGGIRELAAELHRDTHEMTVDIVADKAQVLAVYLAKGLFVAAEEGIDLDGAWLRKPSAKWARAPGSDYDRAIDGMRAWDARFAPQPDERRDAAAKSAWATREGVKQDPSGHACLRRLTDEAGAERHAGPCVHLPGADHSSMWMKEGKAHIYVTQPYDLTLERLEEMFRVGRRLGLTLRVDSAVAWHNPMAVLIEVLRA
jgi:hypothetical protein